MAVKYNVSTYAIHIINTTAHVYGPARTKISRLLSGEPDYFGRNKISSGGDLSHYSSASLY